MMRLRADCRFFFITKRIDRLMDCLPADWGAGYPNVHICCTAENQDRADYRLPILLEAPIRYKYIASEPLLTAIDLSPYLRPEIRQVTVGGESGAGARLCRYEWILDIRRQCLLSGVPFYFKQTGAHFEKDGRVYHIERRFQHKQARKANISTTPTLMPSL